MPVGRRLLRRLVGRLRYGLLTQEILNRLKGFGLGFYPYLIVLEPASGTFDGLPDARFSLRMLGAADAEEVVRVSEGRRTAHSFVESLSRAVCLGIFYGGTLAGYTYAALDAVPLPVSGPGGHGRPVVVLQSHEAYLFDMYVAPQYRGLRLAGLLRQSMQRELITQGRTRFYSITAAFNRSSRRFKSRLGARQIELRICLRLSLAALPGWDLRLWRREPHLASARVRLIPVNHPE